MRQRFFAQADAGGGGSDEGSAQDASDFVSESASVAFIEAPADTTAGVEDGASQSDEGDPGDTRGNAGEHGDTPVVDTDAGEVSASAASRPPAKTAKPKNKVSLPQRVTELKREVDSLTHAKHRTAEELDRDERRLADVRREIAGLEAKRTGSPDATADRGADRRPVPGKAAAADDPMPEVPDYRKFETDADYETAVATYRTAMTAWHGRQNERLTQQISEGMDARFRERDGMAAAERVERATVSALNAVRSKDPEWNQKAQALDGLTSSWYDPRAHRDFGPTPFVTDLAKARLAQGDREGAELLSFLGSDRDRAQRIADLRPTRPLRDALVSAPSVIRLLEHFASDRGAEDFEALKRMPPARLYIAIGALSSRLAPASRGSGPGVDRITAATPSARPPGGTPGARSGDSRDGAPQPFEDWMAAEDARELAEKKRRLGIAS